jgi:hypothetical protein
MLKTFGPALLLAFGLAITAAPAHALQIVVMQVDKNTDGSMTYHFAVKTDQGETLTPGESKEKSDFVTVYNFYGLVDGSVKSPVGWEFSSEEFGRTPYWNGYPLVLPLDVPGTPNLTWTVTKPVAAGGADRRFHRDHPRERDGVRYVHRAGYAPVGCDQRRSRRNAGCRGFGFQTGAYRLAYDAEVPR